MLWYNPVQYAGRFAAPVIAGIPLIVPVERRFGIESQYPGPEVPEPIAANQNRRSALTIITLIDALGWRYAEDFLKDVLPVRTPIRTVLGFSSGAIPAILTGLTPSRTGHWNLFYYNPQGSPFHWLRYFDFLPDGILNHRVSRKILKEMGRRVLGLGPVFECCVQPRYLRFFDWVEKKNIYQAGGVNGPSIFDRCADAGIPYKVYSYHMGTDRQLIEAFRHDLAQGAASFYFLYLSEIDSFLHMHCKDQQRVAEKLAWYSAELGGIFRSVIEADPEANIAVCSDHGMTPVEDHFDLVGGVQKLGLQMPRDYLAVYDSTMARYWFFSEAARDRITNYLAAQSCGRILPDEELKELGVYFDDRRFGEVVFLLQPGCLLERSDFNGPRWNPSGMHGYHPEDADSDGIFLSNKPPRAAMKSVIDLNRWMREATV